MCDSITVVLVEIVKLSVHDVAVDDLYEIVSVISALGGIDYYFI